MNAFISCVLTLDDFADEEEVQSFGYKRFGKYRPISWLPATPLVHVPHDTSVISTFPVIAYRIFSLNTAFFLLFFNTPTGYSLGFKGGHTILFLAAAFVCIPLSEQQCGTAERETAASWVFLTSRLTFRPHQRLGGLLFHSAQKLHKITWSETPKASPQTSPPVSFSSNILNVSGFHKLYEPQRPEFPDIFPISPSHQATTIIPNRPDAGNSSAGFSTLRT